MHFADFTAENVANLEKPKSQKVIYGGNPIMNGCFIKEDTYIGCGFDNAPLIFKRKEGKWEHCGTLDDGLSK